MTRPNRKRWNLLRACARRLHLGYTRLLRTSNGWEWHVDPCSALGIGPTVFRAWTVREVLDLAVFELEAREAKDIAHWYGFRRS